MSETIQKGQFVAFTYKVTDKEGDVLFEATKEAPDTIVYGVTQGLLPGLENALHGLKAGDKFEITLPPQAAYGEIDKDIIFTLPYSVFSTDGKLPDNVKPGATLPMMTDGGQKVYGKVTEVTPEAVTMDFNHPFAGLTVTFSGEVLEVRPATEEELNPRTCGGCCGGGCTGGDCNDDECGGCSGTCGD